jgi:hypothetical protein
VRVCVRASVSVIAQASVAASNERQALLVESNSGVRDRERARARVCAYVTRRASRTTQTLPYVDAHKTRERIEALTRISLNSKKDRATEEKAASGACSMRSHASVRACVHASCGMRAYCRQVPG